MLAGSCQSAISGCMSTASAAMLRASEAGVTLSDAPQGVYGFQDFAGAAEAYGALLQRSPDGAPAHGGAASPAAEHVSALARRAAALLRLGRCQAASADCNAALALLLHEKARSGAGPGASGSACSGAASPEEADAAWGLPAASCPSADPVSGGMSTSDAPDTSSCTTPVPQRGSGDSAEAPCSAHKALSFAHALAVRLQKEAVPADGLAGEGSTQGGACAEAACMADASGRQGGGHAAGHAAVEVGSWGRGSGKLAMLLRLLVRRGSAFAYGKRCEHWASACALCAQLHGLKSQRCGLQLIYNA